MTRVSLAVALIFIISSNLSCTVNILESFADKTTSQSYYYDALDLMNKGDYDGALAKIALITGSLATDRKVTSLKASAYAGKCGLSFLEFVEALQDMGSSSLFQVFLTNFASGTAAKIDACVTAEDLVESIGTVSERTSDENMLLILISFAKIGNVLSLYADSDDDGTVDAAYNSCTVGATRVAGPLTDADVRQVGTGLTLAIENITAVSSTVNLGSSALASVSAACSALNSLNPAYNFCANTNPASFTAQQLKAIRGLITETNDGIGLKTCVGGAATCVCP